MVPLRAGLWYLWYMGKRSSIYLSSDREAAIEASGKTLTEIIDLGLEALSGGGGSVTVADTGLGGQGSTAGHSRPFQGDCKHPRARRAKGLCMACGTYQGTA